MKQFLFSFFLALCLVFQAQAQTVVTVNSEIPCNGTQGVVFIAMTDVPAQPLTATLGNLPSIAIDYNAVLGTANLTFPVSSAGSYNLMLNYAPPTPSFQTMVFVNNPFVSVTNVQVDPIAWTTCDPGDYVTYDVTNGLAPFTVQYYLVGAGAVSANELQPGLTYLGYVTDAGGCQTSFGVIIGPNTTQTIDVVTCVDGQYEYNGNLYPLGYNALIPVGQASSGCDSFVNLNVQPIVNYSYTSNVSEYCTEAKLVLVNPQPGFTTDWIVNNGNGVIFNETGNTATVQPNGSYSAVLSNGTCADTLSVFSSAAAMSVQTTFNACLDSVYTAIPSPLATAPFTYTWADGVESSSENASIGYITAPWNQTFTVTVADANGCTGVGNFWIGAVISGIYNDTIAYATDCEGDVQLGLWGVNEPLSYQLSGPNGFTANDINVNLPVNGAYELTVTDALGCSAQTTLIRDLPETSFQLCNDTLLFASAFGTSSYNFNLFWDGGNCNGCSGTIIPQGITELTYIMFSNSSECVDTLILAEVQDSCPAIFSGYVFLDADGDCIFDDGEFVKPNAVVEIALGVDTVYTLTNANGFFFLTLNPGNYTVGMPNLNALETACSGNQWPLSMADFSQSFNLGITPTISCPLLDVQVENSIMRRCFNGWYRVKVANHGTEQAENAQVQLTLDPDAVYTSSEIPYTSVTGDVSTGLTYTFDLGDLNPYQSTQFIVYITVSCDAVWGSTLCTDALALPATTCLDDLDGYEINVDGICETDSVHFLIQNLDGPFSNADYYIVEDQLILLQAPLNMNSLEAVSIKVAKNGSTYWLGVVTEGNTLPEAVASAVVEGCDTDNSFSTGFTNQFALNDAMDEYNNTYAICSEVLQSYDPNDKQGFPLGYGEQHNIARGTTIDYKIRFQNTGTDTAFTIVVLDTLPQILDASTFVAGLTSHYCNIELLGHGIIRWTFPNIMLPDSNVNEAASHGYATFRITHRGDAPLGSVIENRAAIYFDFNEPIFTEYSTHTLEQNFVITGTNEADLENWKIFPNPTSGMLSLSTDITASGEITAELFNTMGQALLQKTLAPNGGQLDCSAIKTGVYFLKISRNNEPILLRKVIVR